VVTIQDFSYVPPNSERDLMKVGSAWRSPSAAASAPLQRSRMHNDDVGDMLLHFENIQHVMSWLMHCRRCHTNLPASSLTQM
jgi:hypothetical protein